MVEYFRKEDIKLMLLIDELDQLYKSNLHSSLVTLHDLAYLGDQPTGQVSVIACGSSAMMRDLITGSGVTILNIRAEFPRLVGAPNLNETKYLISRVYSTRSVDLEAVAEMRGNPFNEHNKQWLRLVAFTVGCSARAVQRILSDPTVDTLSELFPEQSMNGHNILNNEDTNFLRGEIIKVIYKKNKRLLDKLFNFTQGNLLFHNIANIDWEKQFKQLSYEDVDLRWKRLLHKGLVANEHAGDNHKCRPQSMYPFSMFHIIKEFMPLDVLPHEQDMLIQGIAHGADGLTAFLEDRKARVADGMLKKRVGTAFGRDTIVFADDILDVVMGRCFQSLRKAGRVETLVTCDALLMESAVSPFGYGAYEEMVAETYAFAMDGGLGQGCSGLAWWGGWHYVRCRE
eukprot:gene7501-15350_t